MKPIITIGILVMGISLAGCATTGGPPSVPVIVTKQVVVQPPSEYYDGCDKPVIPENPITDKKVAKYIIKTEQIIERCQTNLKNINSYIKKSAKDIEKR